MSHSSTRKSSLMRTIHQISITMRTVKIQWSTSTRTTVHQTLQSHHQWCRLITLHFIHTLIHCTFSSICKVFVSTTEKRKHISHRWRTTTFSRTGIIPSSTRIALAQHSRFQAHVSRTTTSVQSIWSQTTHSRLARGATVTQDLRRTTTMLRFSATTWT